MIKAILWDIDGTLLNFEKSESYAIRKCFSLFGLGECTDEMIARYSAINRRFWERLEKGELSKAEILVGRFREFFETEQLLNADAEAFNKEYQQQLGEAIHFAENALETLKELRGKVKQYAVTNGTKAAQEKKLAKSGLNEIFDGVFISEDVGFEKPDIRFFDYVFGKINIEKAETIIVGDSLTSDMEGGNRAGILCVWFNPGNLLNKSGVHVDKEIRKIEEVKKLL